MSEYTEESLEKIVKRDLISISLTFQSRMAGKNNNNNEIVEEMRKFKDNFSKPQSGLPVSKCVNTELSGLWPWNASTGKLHSTLEKNAW